MSKNKKNILPLGMSTEFYNSILMDAPFGYASHEIILDESGIPFDYRFLEANKAYSNFTGLISDKIIGKTVREVLPGIENDEFNWISFFGNVALTQEQTVVEQYSDTLGRWYKVFVSSPAKGCFSTLFLESTHEQVFSNAAKELSEFNFENIDYQKIAEWMRIISGADYAVLNKFDKDGRDFTTMAVAGNKDNIQKAVKILNFSLTGRKWNFDPFRENRLNKKKLSRFSSICELSDRILPTPVIKLLESKFNLGEFVVVKTTKGEKMVGDFSLIYHKNKHLQNQAIVESFADLVGITMTRIDAEQQLTDSEEKFRLLAENSSDVIWITDMDLNFMYLSPSTEKMFGYGVGEFSTLTMERLFPPQQVFKIKEVLQYHIVQYYTSGYHEALILESEGIHKNGSPVYIEVSAKMLFGDQGEILGVQGISRDISERKKVEEQLRKSEEKYRMLVETATDSIILLTEEAKIIEVNNATIKKLGYQREEIIGQELGFVDPGFNAEKFLDFWKAQPFNNSAIFESMHRKKDGTEFPVEICSKKFMQNNSILYYGVARDISERKKAEKKFRALIENAPDGVAIMDVEGRLLYASPNAQRIFGYSEEEALGHYGHEFTHPEDLPAVYEVIGNVLSNPQQKIQTSYRFRKKSGEYLWIETTFSNLLNEEAVQGIVMNFTDITDRKNMIGELTTAKEKAEKNSADLLEKQVIIDSVINNIPFDIWARNNEEICFLQNKSSKMVWGNLINKKPQNQDITEDTRKIWLDNNRKAYNGQVINAEIEFTDAFGNYRYMQNIVAPMFIDNKIWGIVGINIDISERKVHEREILEAKNKAEESDRLKSAFLANMSHEIRTPMNGILGFTDLLSDTQFTLEEKKEFIEIIRKSGQRMLNTVNDLIDISKIETGQVQVISAETNLCEQVTNLFAFFQPEAEAKKLGFILKNNFDPISSLVKTDVAKLDSVMTNLIKNAIKYTDSGKIEILASLNGNQFEFYVKDTGIGIPPDRQKAVFNRFEQSDIEDHRALQGSGLGLAISKAYIEMLGGKIELESEPGNGSKFSFTIPVIAQNQYNTGPETMRDQAELVTLNRKLKIIIAEDDPVGVQYLTILLAGYECEILHVTNGAEVVELCRQNSDTDIILMDIQMPVMNGYAATRKIREFNSKVLIIAQTAFALSGDREKAFEAGCNDYISKPVDRNTFADLMKKYFGMETVI